MQRENDEGATTGTICAEDVEETFNRRVSQHCCLSFPTQSQLLMIEKDFKQEGNDL